MENEKGFVVPADRRLLLHLDSERALRWYEPGKLREEPTYKLILAYSLYSLSPDEIRYKELKKNGGDFSYLPKWSLENLLDVARFFRTMTDSPWDAARKELCSDDNVREWYGIYGGIIRHCLPRNVAYSVDLVQERSSAIDDCKP